MSNLQKEIKLPPSTLRTLREESGFTIEEVAARLHISKEKLLDAEESKSGLTLGQIKKLAEIYRRPLVAFFSSTIPVVHKVVDYRINRNEKLPPSVLVAQRRVYYLTEKLKELTDKRSHIPVFPKGLKAEALAQEFRKHLNLQLLKSQKPNNLLARYKDELEKSLNIVIIEYPLKAKDVRAFSISSDICSIVLNEDDNPRIKLFSLFHEVCHILKKTDGICSLDIEKQKSGIEAFCNNFAAGFLVPIQDLKTEVEKYPTIDNSAINELADIYCVSKQVIMIRLLKAGYIDEETYELYKKGIEEKAKQGGYGRKQWEKIYLNRIGHFTLQETKAAYNEGKITFADFLRILDLKAKYGEKYIL